MKKILNYIVSGKGWGFRFILAIAFILSVIFSFSVYELSKAAIPQAQALADEIFPLRVENGVIVEPLNMLKTIPLLSEEKDGISLDITIDTSIDEFDIANLEQGLYISKTALYSVNGKEVKIKKLEGSYYFPKDDYIPSLKKATNWTMAILFPLMLIVISLMLLVVAMFYTIFAAIISAIFKKDFDFAFKMRLSSIAFSTTYVLFFFLGLVGISSKVLFFVAVLALQTIIIKEVPSQTK